MHAIFPGPPTKFPDFFPGVFNSLILLSRSVGTRCRFITVQSNYSLLLIYRPKKNLRLSWLTYSGQFTYISGDPSAVGRVHDRESSLVKDQRDSILLLCQATNLRVAILCHTGADVVACQFRREPGSSFPRAAERCLSADSSSTRAAQFCHCSTRSAAVDLSSAPNAEPATPPCPQADP